MNRCKNCCISLLVLLNVFASSFYSRSHFRYNRRRKAFTITRIDTQDHHNRKFHHTDHYKTKALILRRGQDFLLDIHPSTTFDNSQHKFYIELWTGRKPMEFDRTLIKIRMVKYIQKKKWDMKRTGTHDTKIQLKINIPSTCLVGRYQMRIMNMDGKLLYKHDEPLFVLFNPWSTDDEVYMPNTSDLEEYVLNDQGVLFQGSSGHISPLRWYFGQFENVALETVFELLKSISVRKRDSAREIARRISAFVNGNDEGGIIAGSWSGDYSGGVEPWAWTGSPAMLEQYVRTNAPVKYGQCWNFCGVATTLLRAVGIPTRAISNFNSAHDTDANCTYDRYYDENGEYISHLSTDSTWNFHCWNDVWMERPDLPPGYGGWQAVDATPQERSQGIYQLGPAPLRAVKEGNVKMKYDVRFVFAEVNADTVYWGKMDANDEFRPIRIDRKLIGQNISTKAIGRNSFNRVDISEEYKYPEGSALELATVKRALHLSKNKIIKDTPNDLNFELTTDPHVSVGSDIKLRLSIRNSASKDLNIKAMIGGHIVMYNGMSLDKISVKKSDVKVNRQAVVYHTALFPASQYLRFLHQAPRLRFHVFCTCTETGQIYVTETVVMLGRPALAFEQFPTYWTRGTEMQFSVRIQNPLHIELTECVLRLDGNIMEGRLTLPQRNVPANGYLQMPVKIMPEYEGRKDLIATFTSKELGGFRGSTYVEIRS